MSNVTALSASMTLGTATMTTTASPLYGFLNTQRFDDLYVWDLTTDSSGLFNTFPIGPQTVNSRFASANGTAQGMTRGGSGGPGLAHYQNWSRNNYSTTYSYLDDQSVINTAETQVYGVSSTEPVNNIKFVQLSGYLGKITSANAGIFHPLVRASGVNYDLPANQQALSAGTAYIYKSVPWYVNPVTNLPWTPTDANGYEFGALGTET